MSSFAEQLKRLRKGKGLTQQELAKCIGVAQSAVGNWESGATDIPRGDRLIKLAEVLGVDPGKLVGTTRNSVQHSSDDIRILGAFRSLTDERKRLALKLLKAMK